MSSFTLQRNINNFPIKKTVNFSSTPSVNNNSQSLGSTGSVSSASINILTLNGTQITATGEKLNYVDVTPGTASASKALVLNSSRDISNINSLSCTSLIVNGTAITGNSTPTELTGITAGTASASKALVLNSSRDISNINSFSATTINCNSVSANANTTSLFRKSPSPFGAGVNRTSTNDYAIEIQGGLNQGNHAGLVFRSYNTTNVAINTIGLMPYSISLATNSEATGLRFIRMKDGTAIGDSTNSPFSILATGGCQSSNTSGATIHSFRCEADSPGSNSNISFEGSGSTWARIRATKVTSDTGSLQITCTFSDSDKTCLTLNPDSSGGNLTSINNITYAGTLTGPSDIRLKENIEDADLELCYNNMKLLKLKKYQWKEGINHIDNKKIGWIAQDVEQIFPKSIIETPMYNLEDCKTIGTDQIMATMYGTIQKLMQKVEKLEEFINTLEIE